MATKWETLAQRLAQEIRDGVRAPGTSLPHIRELVAAGEGSKATVHRAYEWLESEGLVVSMRGRGTVVRDRTRIRVPLNRYARVLEPGGTRGPWETATADQGLNGKMDLGSVETLDAPADVAELLELEPGALAVRRRRRALIDTDAVQLQDAWYPLDVARTAGLDDPTKAIGGALIALIESGILVNEASAAEYVQAEVPDRELAAQLSLGSRGAAILVDRVTCDHNGRPVELVRMVGAADRLRLVYSPLPLKIRRPRSSRESSK
jgi:GntR family transcriptional regulator